MTKEEIEIIELKAGIKQLQMSADSIFMGKETNPGGRLEYLKIRLTRLESPEPPPEKTDG